MLRAILDRAGWLAIWQGKLVCVCVCVVYVCVFCSGGGNWCRQDLKWLFSCLTEDKREEKKRTNKVAISQEGEREREGEEG